MLAWCVLHNFIKMKMQDDSLFRQYAEENVEVEELDGNNMTQQHRPPLVTIVDTHRMANFRD